MQAFVLQLLAQGETERSEFKSSFQKKVIETLVAFANAKGGYVLVGVNGGVNELLAFITINPGNSSRQLTETLGVSQRTMERWLKQLKDAGKIEYRGSSKTGGYHVK